jgi:carboxyl-terminal processing protease
MFWFFDLPCAIMLRMIETNEHKEKVKIPVWQIQTLKIISGTLVAVLVFISGVYIGVTDSFFGKSLQLSSYLPMTKAAETRDRVDLGEFWQVWSLLEEKFATASTTDSISDEEKVQGAIAGLVKAYGDPYTMYFPPSESERFQEDISGNFSGVGMEVGVRDGLITVIAPLPGTPAEKAGIVTGDAIVSIDGESTENMSVDEAVRRIRGDKGTVVTLSIYREGETSFREIKITRDTIDIPTVKTETVDDVFIISLYSFNAVSDTKMEEAMNQFVASKKSKLVLDLRGNPGGFMQSAVDVASFYMPSGKIVVRERAHEGGEDKVFRTRTRQAAEFNPKNLVVLVDNGSASASEILAGALKDHQVATVIGVPTFGKGSVQELIDLDNNDSIKITVARWLTPNGVSISNGGLMPDIVVKRSYEDREAGKDPQKEAALKFLRGETVESESLEAALGVKPSGE